MLSYESSVEWLFTQFPAYQQVGISAYKPDLDNIVYLCDYFEIDFNSLRYVHVAGTNGKGSTCNYLASILQEAGYRTGLFTSPHILDFRERIRVNGVMIPENDVVDFCELIRSCELKIKPSFFEITWLLTLKHFIASRCEICVVEVGLGGRLDATNIISPLLSIITNISLDHTAILGDTLPQIAFEKAGIMKANVPCIIGDEQAEIYPVFAKRAALLPCPLLKAFESEIGNSFFAPETYSYKNEKTVRMAVDELKKMGFAIENNSIIAGIKNVGKNTGFRGRFEILAEKPLIIADAAHNDDGIKNLLDSLSQYDYDKLWVIYGASNDKNVSQILNLFPANTQFLLCPFHNMRSLKSEELLRLQAEIKQESLIFDSVEAAFLYGQQVVNENDILLITGSFFLLSDFFMYFSSKDL